jgi:hypothetical protein
MSIPYRVRKALRNLSIFLLVTALVAGVVLLTWLVWLNRFVIYTPGGAELDFELPDTFPSGVLAQPPEPDETVEVNYGDGEEVTEPPESTNWAAFSGTWVTLKQLTEQFDAVKAELSQLPKDSVVMLDLKNYQGRFLYDSAIGPRVEKPTKDQLDGLLAELKAKNCRLIASVPAFPEYEYFMVDQVNWSRNAHGLPKKNGNGSLWKDEKNQCYWLSPTSDAALTHVIQITTELRSMGFSEVVFSAFQLPQTDQIKFVGSWEDAINKAAETLVKACASDKFTVSFIGTEALKLPAGRCRLYLQNVAAADIHEMASRIPTENPNAQLVFLTDLKDTRFEEYGVLRPLDLEEE